MTIQRPGEHDDELISASLTGDLTEDEQAVLPRHLAECARCRDTLAAFPEFLEKRFTQRKGEVHGVLCWDLIDHLDRRSAQVLAAELQRLLGAEGTLLAFFNNGPVRDARYTKFIIVDDSNMQHRSYPAARTRQANMPNRDILRLFPSLTVSDSFLLQNNQREILFRKPATT